MPLFNKPKQLKEITSVLEDGLMILNQTGGPKSEKERRRAVDDVSRSLSTIKDLMSSDESSVSFSGDHQTGSKTNEILTELSHEMFSNNTIPLIIANLDRLDFESSKYVVDLFGMIMQRQVGYLNPGVKYFLANKTTLLNLINGYSKPECAMLYGTMLREVTKHQSLCKEILFSSEFYALFAYVQDSAFDVSSDAFSSLKDLMTRHKDIVAKFLDSNYDTFFLNYEALITSKNYVTKRQALKLLGELLLDRFHFDILNRYVSSVDNLKIMMNLLKSREKQIAYEAFHCFKAFVVNQKKTVGVHGTIYQNRDLLLNFLANFQNDRSDDTQFVDEKKYLIKVIRDMRPYDDQFLDNKKSSQLTS